MTASMAVLQGLAKDGGLFMLSSIPELDVPLEKLASMTYQEVTYEVMKLLLTDYIGAELKDCITRAYDNKFDTGKIAPLAKADGAYYLELYHRSTIVFKDMALSILSHLMTTTARKSHVDREIAILTTMSEDTGKVVMAGFVDVSGTRTVVFYPKDGVSKVQELQMHTQEGDNTFVVAIRRSFDGAQASVKRIFGDKDLKAKLAGREFRFSSANSTSIGRLVPQIICYVYAYAKLLETGEIDKGEKINMMVPTGSLGNILTAYFTKRMEFPVKTLVCASNDDKVLYDFLTTGIYDRKRGFILINLPSMDVLISSNLEHLIYLNTECDARTNVALMRRLSEEGRYEATPEMRVFMSSFAGDLATQGQGTAIIRRLLGDTGYLIDIHASVAAVVCANYKRKNEDGTKTVIASTISPYKFSHNVMETIAGRGGLGGKDRFEIVDALSALSGAAVPQAVEEIRRAAVRRSREYDVDDMKSEVKGVLGIGRFSEKHLPFCSCIRYNR